MKHKTLENVHITWLGYWGIGIWTLENGKKVLVKGWLPGSVVDGKILKQKKDYIEFLITHVRSYDATLMQAEVTCPHYLFAYGQQPTTLVTQTRMWLMQTTSNYLRQNS
jgi:tRNA/tmRNA/rRNA uracil-C5-methylase (TrmA/RlmC/RlmD family)